MQADSQKTRPTTNKMMLIHLDLHSQEALYSWNPLTRWYYSSQLKQHHYQLLALISVLNSPTVNNRIILNKIQRLVVLADYANQNWYSKTAYSDALVKWWRNLTQARYPWEAIENINQLSADLCTAFQTYQSYQSEDIPWEVKNMKLHLAGTVNQQPQTTKSFFTSQSEINAKNAALEASYQAQLHDELLRSSSGL